MSPKSKKSLKHRMKIPKFYSSISSPPCVVAKAKKPSTKQKQKQGKSKATTRTVVSRTGIGDNYSSKHEQYTKRSERSKVRRSLDSSLKETGRSHRYKTPKDGKKKHAGSMNTSHGQRSSLNVSMMRKSKDYNRKLLLFSPYD